MVLFFPKFQNEREAAIRKASQNVLIYSKEPWYTEFYRNLSGSLLAAQKPNFSKMLEFVTLNVALVTENSSSSKAFNEIKVEIDTLEIKSVKELSLLFGVAL